MGTAASAITRLSDIFIGKYLLTYFASQAGARLA
jgi:hypothetical protein